ncbi:MAG: cytochrome o ubiquinol oxidase subunit IV [Chlamydiales bacterium]
MNGNAAKQEQGSFKTYAIGFLLSIVLTLASYFSVTNHLLTGWVLIGAIFTFCLIQVFVQLVFFLHLGKEARPRWNLTIFLFMLLVLVIIVLGSIWIMDNLRYNLGS